MFKDSLPCWNTTAVLGAAVRGFDPEELESQQGGAAFASTSKPADFLLEAASGKRPIQMTLKGTQPRIVLKQLGRSSEEATKDTLQKTFKVWPCRSVLLRFCRGSCPCGRRRTGLDALLGARGEGKGGLGTGGGSHCIRVQCAAS